MASPQALRAFGTQAQGAAPVSGMSSPQALRAFGTQAQAAMPVPSGMDSLRALGVRS